MIQCNTNTISLHSSASSAHHGCGGSERTSGPIRCQRCREVCKGEVVRVQDTHFHVKCFTCAGKTCEQWSVQSSTANLKRSLVGFISMFRFTCLLPSLTLAGIHSSSSFYYTCWELLLACGGDWKGSELPCRGLRLPRLVIALPTWIMLWLYAMV